MYCCLYPASQRYNARAGLTDTLMHFRLVIARLKLRVGDRMRNGRWALSVHDLSARRTAKMIDQPTGVSDAMDGAAGAKTYLRTEGKMKIGDRRSEHSLGVLGDLGRASSFEGW